MKREPRSFVVLKQSLNKKQKDMIINYDYWINFFIQNNDEELFKKYNTESWKITENVDYIFGETLDNKFHIEDYLKYINVNNRYVIFDNCNIKPSDMQLEFIDDRKLNFKIEKEEKINFKTSVQTGLSFAKSKPQINGINFNKDKKKRHK